MSHRPSGGGTTRVAVCPRVRTDEKTAADPAVRSWGVDTVGLAFRPKTSRLTEAIEEVASSRRCRDASGSDVLIAGVTEAGAWKVDVEVARVMAWPEFGLLTVEGRAAPLLTGSVLDYSLVAPTALGDVAQAAGDLVAAVLGQDGMDTEPLLRRCDLASDVDFSPAWAGEEALAAFASVVLPRLVTVPHRRADQSYEGVAWMTSGNRVQLRVYESAEQKRRKLLREAKKAQPELKARAEEAAARYGPRGSTLRLERQLTWPKAKQPSTAEFLNRDLGAEFLGPMAAAVGEYSGLLVAGEGAATERIAEMRRAGTVRPQKASRLLSYVTALQHAPAAWFDSDRKRNDALRDLRRVGLQLDRSLPPYAAVELGRVLEVAAAPWRAAADSDPTV